MMKRRGFLRAVLGAGAALVGMPALPAALAKPPMAPLPKYIKTFDPVSGILHVAPSSLCPDPERLRRDLIDFHNGEYLRMDAFRARLGVEPRYVGRPFWQWGGEWAGEPKA
jgi:hypothetical protein